MRTQTCPPPSLRPAARNFARGSPIDRLVEGNPNYAAMFSLDRIDQIEAVRKGLPAKVLPTLADDMGVTREQLYGWVGIARATAQRKMRRAAGLSAEESERVLALARLIGQVEQVVAESGSPEGFNAATWTADWLTEPVAAVGGRMPGDFLDTADGRVLVAGLVAQMQSGAYA